MRLPSAVAWSVALAFATAAPAQVVLNPTLSSLLVKSCVHSGDAVHALGATPSGFTTVQAIYARSTDGGRTWPLREVPLGVCSDIGGLAASGSTVVAVLRTNSAISTEVHSSDGGATWSAPRALGTFGGFQGIAEIALHVDGATVNAFWTDFHFGAGWLWRNRSTDGGATWLATQQRLDGSNPFLAQGDTRPRCVGDGGNLHLFWTENIGGTLVTMHQRSTDAGATWLPTPQNISPGYARGIVASSGLLFVGTQAPQRSTDQGLTWNAATPPGLFAPVYGGEGTNVIAAKPAVTTINPNLFSFTVMVDTSVDGGLTWRSQPVQALPPLQTSLHPDAEVLPFAVGNAWYVRVHGTNLGLVPDVLLLSVDQGTTWRTVDNGFADYWPAPSRIVATTEVYPSIVAGVLAGHAIVGAGTSGSGGIEPQLRGLGIPAPGVDFTLDLTQALGGSFALLGYGVGAPVAVPFGSATVFVPPPITSLFAPTGGAAGVPGSGGFAWVQPVPNSLVFSGLQLVSQGLVWDAGAADGFAMTAGVESKLH